MAEKVFITKVAGNYAYTRDGKQLQIIGNVRPSAYCYTDGVVVYGYGNNCYNGTKTGAIGGIPVYKETGAGQREPWYTNEKLAKLRLRGYVSAGPFLEYYGGPVIYNTENKVWCLKDIDYSGSTDGVRKYYTNSHQTVNYTGIIVRWRENNPDLQTGEYLRNDAYNTVTEWSVTIDPQTGDPVYSPTVYSSTGWTVAGETPLPKGSLKTLSVNGDGIDLDGIFNTVLNDLRNRHGYAPSVGDILRPPAQLGRFNIYEDDAMTVYSNDLYKGKRLQYDGEKSILNLKVCGICYPEDNNHPLNPQDPTQGSGWWPLEVYYKVRAVHKEGVLTIVYMTVTINGTETVLTADAGYGFNIDGYTWDSLTGDLTKDGVTIYTGNARPVAVSKNNNILFNDRIKPPLNASYNELQVDNDNYTLVKIDDVRKVLTAILGS